MKIRRTILILLFWCCMVNQLSGQRAGAVNDSLMGSQYEELIIKINEAVKFNEKRKYSQIFLQKAKMEKDTFHIIGGYELLSIFYKKETDALSYLDSIIDITQKKPNNFNPANAYLSKAHIYYKIFDNKEALFNYIKANEFALKYKNSQLSYHSAHGIGIIKNRIGDYESALIEHKRNLHFFEADMNEFTIDHYLNSMFAASISFLRLNQLDSSTLYNKKGFKISIDNNHLEKGNLFRLCQGVVSYFNEDYRTSLDSIQKALPILRKTDNLPNLSIAYYYLAQNYIKLEDQDRGIELLKRVDTLFLASRFIDIETRNTYLDLQDYYEKKGNKELQLTYLKRLITVDSVLNDTRRSVGMEINAKYEIPKLISQKEKLITQLKTDKSTLRITLMGGMVVLLFLLILYFNRQRKLQRKFNELISETIEITDKSVSEKVIKSNDLPVPHEIMLRILENLQDLEKQKKFTDQNISLTSLAKDFNTNTSYLSKVINHYKKKSFTQYLNDLRIDYAFHRLKEESGFRRYTIDAIATESGFKSAETFSKTFKQNKGIYPSYLINKLNKLPETQL